MNTSTVTVRLKGFSSFQPIGATPSLTLNFDKFVSEAVVSRSGEDLAQQFRAGPVTVERSVLAGGLCGRRRAGSTRGLRRHVTLNGRDLGLYVLTEGFDRRFLERHFARADGNLYEGGFLTDITQGLQLLNGKNPEDDPVVARLIRAAGEPDPDERFRALCRGARCRPLPLDGGDRDDAVPLGQLLDEPEQLPDLSRPGHRQDRVHAARHGSGPRHASERARSFARAAEAGSGCAGAPLDHRGPAALRRARRGARTRSFTQMRSAVERRRLAPRIGGEGDAASLCSKISTRAAELQFQLADAEELRKLTPMPAFDPSGAARSAGGGQRRSWDSRPRR